MLDKWQDSYAAMRGAITWERMRSTVLAAGAATLRRSAQAVSGTGARRSQRQSTPGRLRRWLAMTLTATVVLWITATVILLGLHGTVQSVRGSTSLAYLDVIEAHAALSNADRAAWESFRTGEAQFAGPGLQFQNYITNASQDLQRLAALSGSAGSQRLQTVSGQLVIYQALVEQAYAAYRTDIALGVPNERLGYAYLAEASNSMRNRGGLLATIHNLDVIDHRTLETRLASPFANPALFLAFALAGILGLGTLIAIQDFLRRRFRRRISSALLLAAALVCVLMAWMAIVILPADSAFAAARVTALPDLTSSWNRQIQTVDATAAALQLRATAAGNASGALPGTATQPASTALDTDLAAAGNTAGLPIGIPALAAAIATLAWLGVKPRMNEYRVKQ